MPDKRFPGPNVTLNARPDRIDLRDRMYAPKLKPLPEAYPPQDTVKEYFEDYSDLVLDQGQEGSCTGFGLAAFINYLLFRRLRIDKVQPPFQQVSPAMIYRLARFYDEWPGENYEGSSCRGAMKGWHKHGVCSESMWPNPAPKEKTPKAPSEGWEAEAARLPLGAYFRVEKDAIADIQAAIYEVGAVYASADVHGGWNLKSTQEPQVIRWKPGAQIKGAHAFAMVGYREDGFIVQNSWGPEWGNHGFAVLSYADWVANGSDVWVASLGAPMFAYRGGKGSAAKRVFFSPAGAVPADVVAKAQQHGHPGVWDETTAQRHSIVLGNDGQAISRLPEAATGEASIIQVVQNNLGNWMMKAPGNRKVAIYGHGGLNSESASMNRIQVMAPYFLANGVFPIFVTWKTGPVEVLVDQFKDAAKGVLASLGFKQEGGFSFFDKAKKAFEDTVDRTLEPVARHLLVKAAWSEMKENAARASKQDGGTWLLARELEALLARDGKFSNMELHLVGHSAGSILHGHFLDALAKRPSLKCSSLRLFAPACTVGFANDHFLGARNNGILPLKKNTFFAHILSDELERDDVVGPYHKSLLYLICRALELAHKTPVLGMEAAWDKGLAAKEDVFEKDFAGDLGTWRNAMSGSVTPSVVNKGSTVDDGVKTVTPTHGGFDNDCLLIEETIRSILGVKALKIPVKYLGGF